MAHCMFYRWNCSMKKLKLATKLYCRQHKITMCQSSFATTYKLNCDTMSSTWKLSLLSRTPGVYKGVCVCKGGVSAFAFALIIHFLSQYKRSWRKADNNGDKNESREREICREVSYDLFDCRVYSSSIPFMHNLSKYARKSWMIQST